MEATFPSGFSPKNTCKGFLDQRLFVGVCFAIFLPKFASPTPRGQAIQQSQQFQPHRGKQSNHHVKPIPDEGIHPCKKEKEETSPKLEADHHHRWPFAGAVEHGGAGANAVGQRPRQQQNHLPAPIKRHHLEDCTSRTRYKQRDHARAEVPKGRRALFPERRRWQGHLED